MRPIVYVSVTFMDAMTPSVSVISGAHDNAAVRVSEVRGCAQMIAWRVTSCPAGQPADSVTMGLAR